MKIYLIIFIFILTFNCVQKEQNNVKKINYFIIDPSKKYSFIEYKNLLLKNNNLKTFPDINDFPE